MILEKTQEVNKFFEYNNEHDKLKVFSSILKRIS